MLLKGFSYNNKKNYIYSKHYNSTSSIWKNEKNILPLSFDHILSFIIDFFFTSGYQGKASSDDAFTGI